MDRIRDPLRLRQVEALLDEALRNDPTKWPSILGRQCGADAELRSEVEHLLSRLDSARCLLQSPPLAVAAAALSDQPRQEGRQIGAYRIEREIGRGGMAQVFLANRADGQFVQRVALKLLRPGLDQTVDRERFRVERQILALLTHPSIARLTDGGVTPEGQPYLVLEYVDGIPIDEYCERHRLPVRARLKLVLCICEAIQYAHRSLIVHRDLKPSNILVDGNGRIKLLDFGLAKLLDGTAWGANLRTTGTGQRWMTPQYAAPEQIRGEAVTTLVDVYQLGAVIFQLLTGRLPFQGHDHSLHELEQAILGQEPDPPSVILARSGPSLAREVRGDLDAVVLRAMQKSPAERYPSVEALAADLRRFLRGIPVLTRRHSLVTRIRRFVLRHRVQTLALAAVAGSLLGGAAVSLALARRAAVERDRAESASQESEAVSKYLLQLFEVSDPAEGRGDTLTAPELVRRAEIRLEAFRDQPAAQARMLEVTARLHNSLGAYSDALTALQRAILLRRSLSGEPSRALGEALEFLSEIQLRLAKYPAADSAAREALAIQESLWGTESSAVAAILHRLGSICVYLGDLDQAERYHRRALAVRMKDLGPEDSLTGTSHLLLGATLRRRGRLDEAEHQARRGLAIYERVLAAGNPARADALLQLAYLLDEGRDSFQSAEPLMRQAYEIRRRALGEGHPLAAVTLSDLSQLYSRFGHHDQALVLARQHLELLHRAHGENHPAIASMNGSVAQVLYRAGRLQEAEMLLRKAIALDTRLRGAGHPNLAGHQTELARVLIDTGEYAQAELLLQNAIRLRELSGGPEHPTTLMSRGMLGLLLIRRGEYTQADSVLHAAISSLERQVGFHHRDVRLLNEWRAELTTRARGQPRGRS